MAYNNIFPIQYPYYQQQPQVQQQAPVSPASSIVWVQGEAGAKSYLVAPNTTVQLWDSESQVIYLKSADASGMPSMKVLDYTIRNNTQTAPAPVPVAEPQRDYVTHSEINDLEARINAKLERLSGRGQDNESSV